MIDTRAVAQEVQDQLLAAMNKGQEQVRKAQEQLRQAQEQLRQAPKQVRQAQEQVRKAQEQVRKAQEQVRKSQEQVRKSREAVTGAIRTGSEFAKAFRPSIPTLPLAGLRTPSLSNLTDHAKLRAGAQDFADQMIAAQRRMASEMFASQRSLASQLLASQRSLADKAFQAASPLVAEGVTRLSKVVATLQDGWKPGQADAADTVAAAPCGNCDRGRRNTR